jgi:hypothetical protein
MTQGAQIVVPLTDVEPCRGKEIEENCKVSRDGDSATLSKKLEPSAATTRQ